MYWASRRVKEQRMLPFSDATKAAASTTLEVGAMTSSAVGRVKLRCRNGTAAVGGGGSLVVESAQGFDADQDRRR